MRRILSPRTFGPDPLREAYWPTTVTAPSWESLEGPARCDVVIVGGGYTGLTAALDLAEAGADVLLLEAEAPGWGASGRNGGFCCLGGAKLDESAMVRRFGAKDTALFHATKRAAVDLVADTLDRLGIDADVHSQGETLLAHRPSDVAALHREAEETARTHGCTATVLSRPELAAAGMSSPEFHGAVTVPIGFALNPLKYALGLAQAAVAAGARICAHSPALGIDAIAEGWQVRTPSGVVEAKRLILATNGYSSEDVPDWLRGRYMPTQSNILVTRELTPEELQAQGWTSTQMCYDTRNLLHYFRLMPNNRMLFGQRGALRGTERAHQAMRAQARADFDRFFPEWQHVETPFFHSGLVALARGLTPFVGAIDTLPNAYAGMCYHGNGVATGSLAGSLLADLALGRQPRAPYPALMRHPLGRYPLGRFRRALLPLAYAWYGLKDRG